MIAKPPHHTAAERNESLTAIPAEMPMLSAPSTQHQVERQQQPAAKISIGKAAAGNFIALVLSRYLPRNAL